jgi:hypothetical protein
MSATRRAVRQAKHNMYVEARVAVVADRNVPDRAQDFALLGNLDFLVCFLLKIEPADGGLLKSTDGSQGGCGKSGIVCEFRQRFECIFAGFENDDAGLGSRVAGYFRALSWPSRGAALGVAAFFDLFDDLGTEGFQIARVAGRDDALVYNDLGVFPFCAGI